MIEYARGKAAGNAAAPKTTKTQTNQSVLTVEFHNVAGGKLEGALLMPFGFALAKGVTLKKQISFFQYRALARSQIRPVPRK